MSPPVQVHPLEKAHSAMEWRFRLELRARGFAVQREVWVDVCYKGQVIARQRLDMVVEQAVVVE